MVFYQHDCYSFISIVGEKYVKNYMFSNAEAYE